MKIITRIGVIVFLSSMLFGSSWDNLFYDYRGCNSFRELHTYLPEEHMDPFTGNVILIYTDLHLAGNGGLDLTLLRVYNSAIYRDLGGQPMLVPDSWMGLGWSMHMGRLVDPDGNEPFYLEMPDGSKHSFYIDKNNPAQWISKEYWIMKINGNYYEIYFTDGVKWRFDMTITGIIPEAGGTTHIYYPTKEIVSPCDPANNKITVYYQSFPATTDPCINYIIDGCGRTINFNYINTANNQTCDLEYIEFNGQYVRYTYLAIPGNSMYRLLQKVQLPADGSGYYSYQYEYEMTNWPQYELRKAYNPWGGRVEYTFTTNQFDIAGEIIYYRALIQRKETDGSNYNAIWTINYAQAGDLSDSTLITDPYGTKTSFTMYGYRSGLVSGNFWKLGLITRKRVSNAGGQAILVTYTYDANPPYISNDDYWAGYGANYDPQVFAPRVTQKQIALDGLNYSTTYSSFDNYNHPQSISETGDASRTISRTYWYNTSLNIVDRLASETINYNSTSIASSFAYNSNGTMSSRTIAGVTTNYTYSTNGNLNRVTDASTRWVEYSSYLYAIPRTINKMNMYSITRTVNAPGTIASETNGRGNTTNFYYDGRNRLIRTDLPGTADDIIIEYATNSLYKQSGTKSGSNWTSWTKLVFDKFGRIDYTQNMIGVLVDCRFDSLNRKTYESFPYTSTNIGRSYTYDVLNRIKRTTYPDNNYTENTYDRSKVTFRNERNKLTEYQYNAFGDPCGARYLISVKDALNQTTTYNYNAAGLLTIISTTGSNNRTYHYNTKYFLDYEISPERGRIDYVYDNAGNITQRTDAMANATGYTYDNITRLTNINYPGTDYDIVNTYDNADNLTQITTPNNSITQTFDAINRIIQKTLSIDSKTYSAAFAYDGRSNITRITYHDGVYVDYTYDNANRVLTIPGFINSSISYHPSGRPSSYTMANTRVITNTYDNRYRTSRIQVNNSVMDEQYGYDAANNLTTLTDNLGSNDQTFAYDNIDRLTTFNGPWGNAVYSYTSSYAMGRRSQETVAGNATNYSYNTTTHRLDNTTGYKPYTFIYNTNGNATSINGTNLTMNIEYDYENHAISLIDTYNGYYTSCYYDGQGNRIKKVVDYIPPGLIINNNVPPTINADPANTHYFLTDPNGNILFESNPTFKHVYLNGQKIARFNSLSTYFIHNDYLGNARAITDVSGARIYYWINYPFGTDYSVIGGSYNSYRYTGKEYEISTKMYFFGARYYHSDLGRFITPDPAYFVPKDKALMNPLRLNFYEHALNNPLKYVDPDGRDVLYSDDVPQRLKDKINTLFSNSETFRDLYNNIWSNPYVKLTIKYIMNELEPNPSTLPAAGTLLEGLQLTGSTAWIMSLTIYSNTLKNGPIFSVLGHEFQHANEIVEAGPTVSNYKAYKESVLQYGLKHGLPENSGCTQAARDMETIVDREQRTNSSRDIIGPIDVTSQEQGWFSD